MKYTQKDCCHSDQYETTNHKEERTIWAECHMNNCVVLPWERRLIKTWLLQEQATGYPISSNHKFENHKTNQTNKQKTLVLLFLWLQNNKWHRLSWAGKMVPWLRALVALPEDPSLVPITQVWQFTLACTYGFRRSEASVYTCTQMHMRIHP